MASIEGKVALITGASSGIGKSTAIEFARIGCRVSLTGRDAAKLDETAKQCEDTGLAKDKIFVVQGDLTNEEELKQILNRTLDHFGKLDILVNNAGAMVMGSVETTTLESYDHQMNINCRAQFHLSHLATPHLITTKGCIVNVSSVCGTRAFPNVLSYCMSKAAIDQMTRCTALELAKYGVRVNAVNPGVVVTELQKRAGLNEEQYKQFLEHAKETHALGRPGTVEEVAGCIAFLASDTASYVTGVTLNIDGGRHAMCPR